MKEFAPHQQRVVQERDELLEKVTKLHAFFSTELFSTLPHDEQFRLNTQFQFMQGYLSVLEERIGGF